MRERPGLLVLHFRGESEEDLHQYAADWRKKIVENKREMPVMYDIFSAHGGQVTFSSPQSYEMTLCATNRPVLSEQVDGTPVQQGVDAGRQLLFHSLRQFPTQAGSNINPQYRAVDSPSDELYPRICTLRDIQVQLHPA